jgi:hypothetical protein
MWNRSIFILGFLVSGAISSTACGADQSLMQLDGRFKSTIHPFLQTYCIGCHGKDKPEGDFDLTAYSTTAAVVSDGRRWNLLVERLKAQEMPPVDAKLHPSPEARREAIDWFTALRDFETHANAGDPGVVLARRLSNSEYNYTIRDLTGVDLQPTREFPVDPSNTAGFDNSGESLAMSPALLNKYLKAAREVADHMFLKPSGFAFAPYPMLVETDQDKYCIQQIIDLYHRQNLHYVDYFLAAWRFKNRAALGRSDATLADFAADAKVSGKYLAILWTTLEDQSEEVGPMLKLKSMWQALPPAAGNQPDAARKGCEGMRDFVVEARRKVETRFLNITAGKIGAAREPMLIWKDVQYATHRRSFDAEQLQVEGEVKPEKEPVIEPDTTNNLGPGKTSLVFNDPGDPDLFVPAGKRAAYETAWGKFSSMFPDMFYMQERGRNYFDTTKDRGRYLSAGFHNMMGYFRDDQPLYELVLDEKQQQELDEMWHELDFVAAANTRMFTQFYSAGSRAEGRQVVDGQPADLTPVDEKSVTSETKIKEMRDSYLAQAQGGNDVGLQAIKDYFTWMNSSIRWVEKARIDAEPTHLAALQDFAARAYRRPLTEDEKRDLLAYYKSCREKDGMDHESAMRESIVSVLMSPDLCYRIDLAESDNGIHALSDYDLASRLSYFLWSSLPDQELLAHAAAGDLHDPKVITAQARRMLKDPRIRALAVEFGGNWLDFRRFEDLNTVDRDRFSGFTNELREAMYEEPVHFLQNVFQNNRSVLDLLYANDTFVNPVLAKHYGMPMPTSRAGTESQSDGWMHIEDAGKYERGGILPMAVFLTKNAPGLRTSPVKRGNWVVKNVLGERIPPPPPVVAELPRDEAKLDLPLREVLARHRVDVNCAACHARFDSMGLVFEDFGPIGERRTKDLGGRPVDISATFPGGSEGAGLEGLRTYIRGKRQDDFVDNLCSKLLAYALGRSLILSDDPKIQEMHSTLIANGYQFDSIIDCIVTSPQFLNKRGRDGLAER